MDWIVTDLFESQAVPGGKKKNWIIIGDRASGYCWAQELLSTKTDSIIQALNTFNRTYSGPPYRITSDGGPQFAALNKKIATWASEAGIHHELSSALSPQSNGEAEACVKRIKSIIAHALLGKADIKSAIANGNNLQRPTGQGSPAELFFKHSTRLPGLATLPKHQEDFNAESTIRSDAREKQRSRTEKLREPTQFTTGEKVAICNTDTGCWTSTGTVVSR